MAIQFQTLAAGTDPRVAARTMLGRLGWTEAKALALKLRDEAASPGQRNWVEDVIDELEFSRAIRDGLIHEGSAER